MGELLEKALADGDLENRILNTNTLAKVTAVVFIGNMAVKPAAANGATPTQLEGKCLLSGMSVADFLDPQRNAFKSILAVSSGVADWQVLIKDVSAATLRR